MASTTLLLGLKPGTAGAGSTLAPSERDAMAQAMAGADAATVDGDGRALLEGLSRAREEARDDMRADDPCSTALVHPAVGRHEEAAAALRRALDRGWAAEQLYGDDDLAPLPRAQGADALREVVPRPEEDPGR